MKYLVSRDVGHLKFTKIKNPKSPFRVLCMFNNFTLQDIAIPIYVNYKSMIYIHMFQNYYTIKIKN